MSAELPGRELCATLDRMEIVYYAYTDGELLTEEEWLRKFEKRWKLAKGEAQAIIQSHVQGLGRSR